eukprot:scaffold10_cov257-Pinguiococcus_pyrenoidosus.AAC.15
MVLQGLQLGLDHVELPPCAILFFDERQPILARFCYLVEVEGRSTVATRNAVGTVWHGFAHLLAPRATEASECSWLKSTNFEAKHRRGGPLNRNVVQEPLHNLRRVLATLWQLAFKITREAQNPGRLVSGLEELDFIDGNPLRRALIAVQAEPQTLHRPPRQLVGQLKRLARRCRGDLEIEQRAPEAATTLCVSLAPQGEPFLQGASRRGGRIGRDAQADLADVDLALAGEGDPLLRGLSCC